MNVAPIRNAAKSISNVIQFHSVRCVCVFVIDWMCEGIVRQHTQHTTTYLHIIIINIAIISASLFFLFCLFKAHNFLLN